MGKSASQRTSKRKDEQGREGVEVQKKMTSSMRSRLTAGLPFAIGASGMTVRGKMY